MWVSDTSIKQPVLVTMLMVLALVLGLLAYAAMPVDLLPDISFPTISVTVALPGAGPTEMADQVAKPIEDGMGTLQGVRHITSRSSEGVTTLVIEFESSRKVDAAAQDVRDKMAQVKPQLPQDATEPIIQQFDLSSLPIMSISAASKDTSVTSDKLRQKLSDEIVPRLQRVDGVAAADLSGGLTRQIQVNLNLAEMQARGITPQQVAAAIQAENITVPGGKVTQNGADISIRTPGQFQTVDSINDVNLQARTGLVHLHQIADVTDGTADVTTLSRLNGLDTIRIDVRKQSGTNTVSVADGVKAQLAQLGKTYPDLNFTVVRDDSIMVRESVNDALIELVLGVIAAVFVVFIFFRDVRNTLVSVIGLPIILIGTFAVMRVFGLTLNIMTLLALTLAVGLVIDDAIVVRENIFRYMERGYDPKIAASRATAQVSTSVLAMTLTLVSVFLPVALVGGVVAGFFRPFGITVAAAMLISLVEAFTLAPMLSAYFFKRQANPAPIEHEGAMPATEEAAMLNEEMEIRHGRFDRFYRSLLAWTIRHRWATVAITVLIIVGSLYAARGLKVAFAPSIDNGQFSIGFRMPPGTTLAETDKVARNIEQVIQSDPTVESVLTTVGAAGAPEQATLSVQLKHGEKIVPAQERLRPILENVPNISLSTPSMGGGGGTDVTSRPIQLQLQTSGSLDDLTAAAAQVQAAIKGIPGVTDVDTDYQPGRPELQVQVDRHKASDLGVSTAGIGSTLRTLVNGQKISTFRQGGSDYDIVLRLRPEDRQNVSDVLALNVPSQKGGSVALNQVADVTMGSSPTRITRQDRLYQVAVGANNFNRNLNDVVTDIRAATRNLQLPAGVTITVAGQQQQQTEGFTTLLTAMALSFVFIYMVLASQFGSFLQPFIIMLAIPLSFIGAFLGLRVTGLALDILGLIGMILLMGLSTKNSILLIDFTNRLRRAGMNSTEALLAAAPTRLRPILMTTLAIMIGAIPVAIGVGQGSEFRRPLAIVTIFGLLTSTLLTLFIVPVAYSLLDSGLRGGRAILAWRPGRRRKQTPAPQRGPEPVPPVAAGGSD
ncbi:MAG: efflux RND transporter permease subunit [Anaerolineae bacterium]